MSIWKEYANKYCLKDYYCGAMKVGELETMSKMKTDCIHYYQGKCVIKTRKNNCKNCKYYEKRIFKRDCKYYYGCQIHSNYCNDCKYYESE